MATGSALGQIASQSADGDGIIITDDDSAASNGTAVNVVPELNGVFASLVSTTENDANTTFETAGGSVVVVIDSDTPGGVQVYFDEEEAQSAISDLYWDGAINQKSCRIVNCSSDWFGIVEANLGVNNTTPASKAINVSRNTICTAALGILVFLFR